MDLGNTFELPDQLSYDSTGEPWTGSQTVLGSSPGCPTQLMLNVASSGIQSLLLGLKRIVLSKRPCLGRGRGRSSCG